MGITTTLRLVKFSLWGIHLFAWPVIALGYPLFASIRAVENGSIYQMRKLVIYWILLSLFSLFEFSFVRILEWIPFWSSARLVLIFWLVMPRFEGACIVYHGLVRPILLVKLQAVIYSFFNLEGERLCSRETCLDVIDNYISEYGLKALEKLIVPEHESQSRIDFQRGAKIIEQEEENSAATSKQSISSARVRNGINATTKVKEMAPPKASAENRRCETIPLEKTQQAWTCDLCNVTSVSRSMLNAHLQGSKHKSKVESLKASLLDAIDTGPSPLKLSQSVSAARDLKGTNVDAVVNGIMQPKETVENSSPEAPLLEKTQQEWSCDLCKVTTMSETIFNSHLQGRKHKSKLESTLKASTLGGKDERPLPSATSKWDDGNVAAEKLVKESCEQEKLISSKQHAQSVSAARDLKGTYVDDLVKGIMQPKETVENSSPEAPLLEKTQQEWSCDLCKVTTMSETIFNSHLQGRKHKSKLESTLKASTLGGKDERPSPSATSKWNDGNVAAEKLVKESCEQEKLISSKQHAQSVSAARDLKGTHVDDLVKGIMQPKETAENSSPEAPLLEKTQQEWSCDLCKMTTMSETIFNSHLQGRKHKSKLESTLKASTLGGKDKRSSPSATSKWNDGNVAAEKLIKESCEQKKLIASKVQYTNAEVAQPKAETPIPTIKKAQQEWGCGLCKVGTTSEKNLNDHLWGSKHKFTFESLKLSMLHATDTDTYKVYQSNLVVTEIKAGALKQYWCNVCGVNLRCYVSVESHLKEKRHASKMNLWLAKSEKVEATIPKNMP